MTTFAELVEQESRGLVAAVTAIVGDPHRAEEVVQEAFERCYVRWRRVSRLDRPGAWARRVAINEGISVARRSASEAKAVKRYHHAPDSGAGGGGDPLAGLGDDGVWASVRALPRDQAVAIALRYGADLGIDDIAETMETSPAAVRSLLHRGRSRLRNSADLRSYL